MRQLKEHLNIPSMLEELFYFNPNFQNLFWSYAIGHATYIINKVSSTILQNKSPYQLLFNHDPDFASLKGFGSLCFASTLSLHKTKLESKSKKCLFLGYKFNVKCYILFDLKTKQIFSSTNVLFYEHILPYKIDSANQHFQTYDRHRFTDESSNSHYGRE